MPSPFDDIFGSSGPQWTREQIIARIRGEADKQKVDPDLAVAVATQESSLDPNNPGDNGASRGVFHLQRKAAIDTGIDPKFRDDVSLGIYGGVRYLKQKLAQSKGNVEQALSRYNRGTPDYRGIGDPDYVYHVMRHYPGGHPLGQAPTDQDAYRARLNNTFGAGTAPAEPRQQPGILARMGQAISPASAEAATPSQGTPASPWDDIFGPQTPVAAPTSQQPTPPVSQTTPTPQPPPGASQVPLAPETSWTPGMRFQALPSIQQLEPAERTQRTQEFARLTPALQEEFLRSEEPASDLTLDIAKPSTPQAQATPSPAAVPRAPGVVRPVGLTQLTPDMDEDAIISALGYDPAVIKKAPGYRPGVFKEGVTDPAGLEARILNSPVGGFARGAQDVAEGLVQLAARGGQKLGVVSPERVAFFEAMMKLAEANYQQNIRQGSKVDPQTGEAGIFSDPSRLVGQAAAVPIPGGAATTIPRILARGAVTGAVSGAVQPVQGTSPQPGSDTDDFWTQKAWQTGTGGVLGGGLNVAGETVVTPLVNRGVNWARGVVNPAYQKIVELGDRFGVRLSAPEITMSPTGKRIETGLEATPGAGYGTFRRTQQQQARGATEGMVEGLQQDVQATAWRDLPGLQRAAGQGDKQAQALLAEINTAGDDWGRVIQSSGKLNLWQDRRRAAQLYDRVERLAQPLGNMPVKRTVDAMDTAIDDVRKAVLPSPELQKEIETFMTRAKTEITPAATGAVPDTTYGRMKRLREDLGDMQRTATDPRTARYLGQVKSALQEDMRDFAVQSNVPALVKAHSQADQFYRTRVVPYREGQLAKAIEKDIPDEIYTQFVHRGKDRAQYFYNGLDPKGQAAVRSGMVEEAYKKAMSGPDPDIFSPARFVSGMREVQEASGVFFKGTPQWEIDGFTTLMQHAKRAGQYMENPPTGWRAGALGLLLNPWLYLQAVGAGQGVKTLFTSRAGRSLLLAANDLQPGSPALQRAWNQFARQVPRAAAIRGSGQVDQPSQPSR